MVWSGEASHGGVGTIFCHESGVGTGFEDLALLEDNDAIGIPNR